MFKLPWQLLLPIVSLPFPFEGAVARPDPLDASARVPAATHRSAFATYRPHADANVRDWKAANETVGRIGGWRAYAREANAPASAPAGGAPAAPQAPGGHGHGGHPQGEKP